ncbi:MAG: YHS domain-containing protein [Candidatus Polarisedimenticolaceae bacterium]|nr:YHS domain-containing protein [Candidatus Polarisedimenticolaceae bacterium]
MAHDPVCLMELDPRKAKAVAEYKGRTYYFCSAQCREKFLARPEIFLDKASGMRLTVGVMGSAGNQESQQIEKMAYALGETIAKRGFVLITGACPGLPYECARDVTNSSGLSIGISPALSLDEHLHKYHSPSDSFDVIIYTGSGLMGREVTNIRSSDIVIILGGRSGTLGEFAIAYDEGKLIGVLEGSGGITGKIPDIIASFGDKDTGAQVVYDPDPQRLMAKLAEAYTTEHYQHPSCFCHDTLPAG